MWISIAVVNAPLWQKICWVTSLKPHGGAGGQVRSRGLMEPVSISLLLPFTMWWMTHVSDILHLKEMSQSLSSCSTLNSSRRSVLIPTVSPLFSSFIADVLPPPAVSHDGSDLRSAPPPHGTECVVSAPQRWLDWIAFTGSRDGWMNAAPSVRLKPPSVLAYSWVGGWSSSYVFSQAQAFF